jgi:hypothetical protein
MTLAPSVKYRSAYVDRSERFEIKSPLVAAALLALGHELVGVVHGRLLFRNTARADYARINRNADEARAMLERTTQSSTSKGQGHVNDDRQQ